MATTANKGNKKVSTGKVKEEVVKDAELNLQADVQADEAPVKAKKEVQKREIKRRVKIDREAEVLIRNNIGGTLILKAGDKIYRLDGYGSTEYLTIAEIQKIMNTSRKLVEDLFFVIVDLANDEDFTLEDVLQTLGIARLYEENKVNDVEEFLLNTPSRDFERTLRQLSHGVLEKVTERAVALFKEDEFSDSKKMFAIEKVTGLEDLFKDVQQEMEDEE